MSIDDEIAEKMERLRSMSTVSVRHELGTWKPGSPGRIACEEVIKEREAEEAKGSKAWHETWAGKILIGVVIAGVIGGLVSLAKLLEGPQ